MPGVEGIDVVAGPANTAAHGGSDADRPRRPAGQIRGLDAGRGDDYLVKPFDFRGAAGADPSAAAAGRAAWTPRSSARGTLALDPIPPRSHGFGGSPAGPDVHRYNILER